MEAPQVTYSTMMNCDASSLHPSLLQRYTIVGLLGSGGMGKVYLAQDTKLSRLVAIKTIRPDLNHDLNVRKRIDQECLMHAAVGAHPNIVALYDRFECDSFVYLILEYVEGVLLEELLKPDQHKPVSLSIEDSLSIILQILEGLKAIHSKNILHRDITPSNVIVSKLVSGVLSVKLMDFGIARSDVEDSALTRLTAVDVNGPGTPIYMAPERIDPQSFGDLSPATDLYSVGIVLYQMLNDVPPFGGTVTEILIGHLTKEIDFSSCRNGIPVGLKNILAKALSKKQENRFQDAAEFCASIHKFQTTQWPSVADVRTVEQTLLATEQHSLRSLTQKTSASAGIRASEKFFSKSPSKKLWTFVTVAVVLAVSLIFLLRYFLIAGEQRMNTPEPKSVTTIDLEKRPLSPEMKVREGEGTNDGQERETVGAVKKEGSDSLDLVTQKSQSENSPSLQVPPPQTGGRILHNPVLPNKETLNKDSASAAFESARSAALQTSPTSPASVPPEPKKNSTEPGRFSQNRVSREKADSPAAEQKCRNLTKNWQLGDSTSIQQLQKECAR